ncbi:MAG: stage II sporulation protein D [Firmicutes bacterium RBG_13_65_8]|nr:MAG: stage II sporulation protein D [Firmicutes bacterium RBG_13_65_8]
MPKVRQRLIGYLLALFVFCVLMPVIIVRGCSFQAAPREPASDGRAGPYVQLYVSASGTVDQMDLEEYVKGVVAAEMPASFHLEALKAQAVLARTFVVKRMRVFGGQGDPDHPTADISDDPARGQAWLAQTALRERWGLLEFAGNWARIEKAVEGTRGLIAVYQGDPIEAAYHSTCGGSTEAASNVWQVDLPYYTPIQCLWDSHSPFLEKKVTVAWKDLESKLGLASGSLAVPAAAGHSGVVKVGSRTTGGRVGQVVVGDLSTTGVALRKALGLPSANFQLATSSSGVAFTVRGYGHGVGMCQYGADGLAREGRTYAEIIATYLPGVTVRQIFHE